MITPATFDILEQSSGVYRATVVNEAGVFLPGSTLTSLKLTLYVVGSGGTVTYINSRNEQNVLNTNGVLVYDTLQTAVLLNGDELEYSLAWTITPSDTTLVAGTLKVERHIALFEWTWGVGKSGKHEVILAVKNLNEV